MIQEIIEKYALMKHRTAIQRIIANETKVSFNQISQRWFNKAKGFMIPEKHQSKVLEIIEKQLLFQEVEKKHYESLINNK